jgi:hypothetical protein
MVYVVLIVVENLADARAIVKAVKAADPETLVRTSPAMPAEEAAVLIQAFEELQPIDE